MALSDFPKPPLHLPFNHPSWLAWFNRLAVFFDSAAVAHSDLQGVQQADPTSSDTTRDAHVSDNDLKLAADHRANIDNPHSVTQAQLGISTFISTLLDDADEATARATLGVSSSSGKLLQVQKHVVTSLSSVTADVATADTAIDTSNTEEILTVTVTPESETSTFYIKWHIMGAADTFRAVMALFDTAISATDAVRVTGCNLTPNSSSFIGSKHGVHSAASVGTSSRTFSVRVGSLGSGTVYLNSGDSGTSEDYGGTSVAACTLEVWEVEA